MSLAVIPTIAMVASRIPWSLLGTVFSDLADEDPTPRSPRSPSPLASPIPTNLSGLRPRLISSITRLLLSFNLHRSNDSHGPQFHRSLLASVALLATILSIPTIRADRLISMLSNMLLKLAQRTQTRSRPTKPEYKPPPQGMDMSMERPGSRSPPSPPSSTPSPILRPLILPSRTSSRDRDAAHKKRHSISVFTNSTSSSPRSSTNSPGAYPYGDSSWTESMTSPSIQPEHSTSLPCSPIDLDRIDRIDGPAFSRHMRRISFDINALRALPELDESQPEVAASLSGPRRGSEPILLSSTRVGNHVVPLCWAHKRAVTAGPRSNLNHARIAGWRNSVIF